MEQYYAAFLARKIGKTQSVLLSMDRNWNRHDSGSFWNFTTLTQWSSIKLMQLWQLRTFHRLPKEWVKKVLRVFLLAIHSYLYSFALRFLFLQTHATSYSFYSSITVHCKGERRKTWEKTITPSLWFKNPYKNLKTENSQDYTLKPQQNCTVMNLAVVLVQYT